MTRNRVMQATALAAILLAFGLAGCGGSEPAPVATPPAPPPAPPPFQPAPVEVALGELGGTATLMTKEGGGFTLNGEDFTGGNVEGDNGMTYALTLADGSWSAAHVPMEVSIEMGTSGGMVTLSQGEDGTSYAVVGSTGVIGVALSPTGVPQGAQALNGNQYAFALVEGVWMATFIPPAPVAVGLGMSGESVHVQMMEDGSYSIGENMIEDGAMVEADNGNMYALAMMDGMWMATYSPMMQEVTLGMTGEMVTVTKAEDGSYWLGDDELMSGGMATASNGNNYTLTMDADGHWMAAFAPMATMTVALGTSGGSVMVNRNENGSYTVVGLSMVSGSTIGENGLPSSVTASNGNMYSISEMDGAVTAKFMAPAPVMVALGMSGETREIQRAEDGSYWLDDMAVSGGETVTLADGKTYTLSMMDGMWMATFMGDSVEVMLGMHGGSVTIATAEDGTYWVGDMALTDGGMVPGDGGRMYTLMMGEDGMWTATYVMEDAVTVSLGTAGSVMLQLAEDGSWWHGETAVADGSMVQAENGASYQLMLADGMWSASYQGVQMMIEGTGLTAVMLEDGTGYDVSGAMLPASGMGSIMVGDASYQVWMEDGMLKGARYQTLAWDDSTDHYAGNIPNNGVTFVGNDEDTPQDESRTGLKLDGDTYSMADLLGAGMASHSGTNYVAKAAEEIGKIRVKAAALFEAFSDDSTMLRSALDDLWADDLGGADGTTDTSDLEDDPAGAIEAELVKVFGARATAHLGNLPDDTDDVLDEIDDIIAALSSVEDLMAADADEGMWEGILGDESAGDVFDATNKESTVWLGVTGSGHYGAVAKKERPVEMGALGDLKYMQDNTGTTDVDESMGVVGAFAYSTLNDTARSRYVQASGSAYYEGGTVAVSGTGVGYAGDISVRINFTRETVDGLVTNLATADGTPWEYNFADVDAISLSQAKLRTNGTWTVSAADTATNATRITTVAVAGAGRGGPQPGMFEGELVGGNGADAGSEVVGTWSVGVNDSDGSAQYLAGGFGAVRGEDIPDTRPAVDDGTGIKTKSLAMVDENATDGGVPFTMLEDGMLKIMVQNYAWNNREDTDTLINITDAEYATTTDDTDTEDVDERHLGIEISLASLFENQNAEHNTNGPMWVAVARDEIETVRTQLAALIDSDQNPGASDTDGGAQQDLWEKFQWIVATKLFYRGPTSDTANPLATTDIAADYDKKEALGVIDDVLQALSGATALDDALDEDGGGVFTLANGDPITKTPTAADMWNQRQYQVKTWLGSTDYTRFGVWRVRRTMNAVRDNKWQRGGVTDQRDAFAYSPLAEAKIPGLTSPAYPTGSTATYEGSTIAWATTNDGTLAGHNLGQGWGLEGSIALTVAWGKGTFTNGGTPQSYVGGEVTAVISDLIDADGDPLVLASDGKTVRQITFGTTTALQMNVAVNSPLSFSETGITARVHYTDFTSADALTSASLEGSFVGLSSQGPLAVIGRWGSGTGLALMDPNKTDDPDTPADETRVPVTILGAFGADLP